MLKLRKPLVSLEAGRRNRSDVMYAQSQQSDGIKPQRDTAQRIGLFIRSRRCRCFGVGVGVGEAEQSRVPEYRVTHCEASAEQNG